MTAPSPIDPTGSLTDVDGVLVGHTQRIGRGWRTGTTVVLTPGGAVGGVDVRGGGPGTRETDLLRPENSIQQVHAVCLTGGSAFGLAAASGVMNVLESEGVGFAVGAEPAGVVPIVPAAVIFDLGRGGRFTNRPDASFGERAARVARAAPEANGAIGAGTGAVAGGLQGGVGSASTVLASGVTVAALAVVNAAGSLVDPATGLPWITDGQVLRRPSAADRRAVAALWPPRGPLPLNTTIGVVATDAELTKPECARVASVAHDGMARAIRPVHSMFDGDTVFALATGIRSLAQDDPAEAPDPPPSRAMLLNAVLDAAARCFAVACTTAVLSATTRGGPPAYRDLCPSAFASRRSR